MKEENIEYCLKEFYYPIIDKYVIGEKPYTGKGWYSGINNYQNGKGLSSHDYVERKELLKRLKHYAENHGLIAYYGDKYFDVRILWVVREDDKDA